jgi:SAM-dependent methyltransferase
VTRDPTTRFTDRVEAYLRYRPSYPTELLDLLESVCGLGSPLPIADIGSGTGILTRLFLKRGHQVIGVEPNRAMRLAAERSLSEFESFTSVEGTAENTTLADDCVHSIVSAQAFHWFHRGNSRTEFGRILCPSGWVAIVWNDRRKSTTPFLRAFETLLLRHGTDYELVDHTRVSQQEMTEFFGPAGFSAARFDNHQVLDYEGLQGRLESSSYTPQAGTAAHGSMIEDLQRLFETHHSAGTVSLDYDTLVYYGQLS